MKIYRDRENHDLHARTRAALLFAKITENHTRTGDDWPGYLGVEPWQRSKHGHAEVVVRHTRVDEVLADLLCPSEADAWLVVRELAALLAAAKRLSAPRDSHVE